MTDTPNPVDTHVGARIRARRKQLEVSQEKLSDALGLTFQQVQKYERGTNRVSASKLFAIAEFLGTPVAWFFEGLAGQTTTDLTEQPPLIALATCRQGPQLAEAFVRLSPAQQGVVVSLTRQLAGAAVEEMEE